ncbi:MAG TPA: purine-nucleoside phosphorylase [Gemmatimonadaceae bacterium]|nr:purine-nucleoside phosphorylase [Gemmatimonadaceae bacterium]
MSRHVPAARYGVAAARDAAKTVTPRLDVALGGEPPIAGIILGSGLGGLADRIENAVRISFAEIPGFPSATVVGHAGALIAGRLADRPVLALAGRFHMYEGHDAALAAFPVRVLHALGVGTLIVSNAAGGVRRTMLPGALMLIADHINLMGRNPLIGELQPGDERFPDMSAAYSPELRRLAHEVAHEQGTTLEEGVYVGLLGPAYETPAEVRMVERLGGDAVGMSTIPEVIMARTLGVRVLGVSCITNQACGISTEPLSHADVLETTTRVATQFENLIMGVVAKL